VQEIHVHEFPIKISHVLAPTIPNHYHAFSRVKRPSQSMCRQGQPDPSDDETQTMTEILCGEMARNLQSISHQLS